MAYPKCTECGSEIDPAYFGYEKGYRVGLKLLCKECFKEYLENNYTLDEIADALGVVVVRP